MNFMTTRANFQKNYLMRYGVLAAVCMFLALWFAYDGFIGYPSKIPAAEAYDELRELETEERLERWQQIASEQGWSSSTPDKTAEEIHDDITGQYFWAAINLLVGVPAVVLFLRCRGSWVEATEDGLTTSWGQTLRFADVRELNKKRWADKGIAKASYTADGQSGTFVFDDFKFEREPLGQMLRDLERVLDREQIVGGPTEIEMDEKKEAEKAPSADAETTTEVPSADDGSTQS